MRKELGCGMLALIGVFGLMDGLRAELTWEQTKIPVKVDPLQEQVNVSFKFFNSGTGNVAVKNVITSCKCTAVGQKQRIITSGERGEIEVTISLEQLGSKKETKRVLIVTDENEKRPYSLAVEIEPPVFFRIDKESLHLTAAPGSSETIYFAAGDVNEITFLGVNSSDDRIDAKLIDGAKGVKLTNVAGVKKAKGTISVNIELTGGIRKVVKLPFEVSET